MSTVMFDTHKAIKELQEVGFDEPQAEVVVATIGEVFGGNLATKEDIADVKREIDDARREIADVNRRVDDVRSEMATKSDLQALEIRLLVRLGGFMAGVAGITVALIKLL